MGNSFRNAASMYCCGSGCYTPRGSVNRRFARHSSSPSCSMSPSSHTSFPPHSRSVPIPGLMFNPFLRIRCSRVAAFGLLLATFLLAGCDEAIVQADNDNLPNIPDGGRPGWSLPVPMTPWANPEMWSSSKSSRGSLLMRRSRSPRKCPGTPSPRPTTRS